MENSTYYTYSETVDVIEKFMKETGIRNYCESICEGHCCGACYTRDTACHRNEGRRLACSHYLCCWLKNLIFPDRALDYHYDELGCLIRRQLSKARGVAYYTNPYFIPYTREQMDNFRIPKLEVDKGLPSPYYVAQISRRVTALVSLGQHIWKRASKQLAD